MRSHGYGFHIFDINLYNSAENGLTFLVSFFGINEKALLGFSIDKKNFHFDICFFEFWHRSKKYPYDTYDESGNKINRDPTGKRGIK